jgi:S1-C subfamily serine protease
MFGLKIPVYHVRNLKLASPAYKAGLQEGDVITAFISPARALADQYSLRAWSREAYSTGHGTIKILRKEAGRYNPIEIKLEKE